MAEASISVDLFNPGQVFASLGFIEAADVLLGDAEGGFDWSDEANVRFRLRAGGDENPFGVVLRFLVEAEIRRCAPIGYADSPPKKKRSADDHPSEDDAADGRLDHAETFPNAEADPKTLPVRLEHGGSYLDIGHWCDGSSRNHFRLYAGQQRGPAIARAMLQGVAHLWAERGEEMRVNPLDLLIPMGGGSFKFDARKAWTTIDAGYSPDEQSHSVAASPVVEILAAVGLEHARPDEYDRRRVRYAAWTGLVPPILARPALAGLGVGIPVRRFRFVLSLSGKNKVVTFAQEEIDT